MNDSERFVPVDRARAMMRGGWRMLAALVMAAGVREVCRSLEWDVLSRTDRASHGALVALAGLAALLALSLGLPAFRWLLLAIWPGRMGITWHADHVAWRLGPFGSQSLPQREWAVHSPPAESEWLDDGEALPRIVTRDGVDVVDLSLRFGRIDPAGLAALLRANFDLREKVNKPE